VAAASARAARAAIICVAGAAPAAKVDTDST